MKTQDLTYEIVKKHGPIKGTWTREGRNLPSMLMVGTDNYMYVLHNHAPYKGSSSGVKDFHGFGYSYAYSKSINIRDIFIPVNNGINFIEFKRFKKFEL